MGRPCGNHLRKTQLDSQNCGSQLWMILSLGDIWQFLEIFGCHTGLGAGGEQRCCGRCRTTLHYRAWCSPNCPSSFQVFELKSYASIMDLRACAPKSALNPFTSLPSQEVYPEIQLILLHPGFLSRTLLFLSPGPAGRLTEGRQGLQALSGMWSN